ncbi:hypothetical protein [Actinomadura gamaensis]|uniref:Uncharacterized protein n=1 Tax=Actinomadura gamaensis TaxID=1763541 RepID=A0ABV9UCR2_9ACTN
MSLASGSGNGAVVDVLLVVSGAVALGLFLAGAAAYAGVWKSWYPDGFKPHGAPLAVMWFAIAWLGGELLWLWQTSWTGMPVGLVVGAFVALAVGLLGGRLALRGLLRPVWVRRLEKQPPGSRVLPENGTGTAMEVLRRMQPKLVTALAVIAVLAILIDGVGGIARPAWWYVSGTSARATIDDCWRHSGRFGKSVRCSGHWTLAEQRSGRGRVYGVGRDDLGKTVPVRATSSRAVVPGMRLLLPPIALLALLGLLGYAGYRSRAAKRGKRGRRPKVTESA